MNYKGRNLLTIHLLSFSCATPVSLEQPQLLIDIAIIIELHIIYCEIEIKYYNSSERIY